MFIEGGPGIEIACNCPMLTLPIVGVDIEGALGTVRFPICGAFGTPILGAEGMVGTVIAATCGGESIDNGLGGEGATSGGATKVPILATYAGGVSG
jgi:hypothetical protein